MDGIWSFIGNVMPAERDALAFAYGLMAVWKKMKAAGNKIKAWVNLELFNLFIFVLTGLAAVKTIEPPWEKHLQPNKKAEARKERQIWLICVSVVLLIMLTGKSVIQRKASNAGWFYYNTTIGGRKVIYKKGIADFLAIIVVMFSLLVGLNHPFFYPILSEKNKVERAVYALNVTAIAAALLVNLLNNLKVATEDFLIEKAGDGAFTAVAIRTSRELPENGRHRYYEQIQDSLSVRIEI